MQKPTDIKKQLAVEFLSDNVLVKMRADALQIFEMISMSYHDQNALISQNQMSKLANEQRLNQQLVTFWFKWIAEEGFGGKDNNPCFDNICFYIFRYIIKFALNSTYPYCQLIKDFISKFPVFRVRQLHHKPIYDEMTQNITHFPTLKEIIRDKVGLFSGKLWTLSKTLPKDIVEFISIDSAEIFTNISNLVNDRNLFISENKLSKLHELSCIINHEQEFFNLLAKSYQTEIYYQEDYAFHCVLIPRQGIFTPKILYNRNRHLVIDKYLHKNFGISGFITDIFIQLLNGQQAPIDNFEMLMKLFCIKIIYEKNGVDAKFHFINNILKESNRNYPQGIFKEENNKLFIMVMQQWFDIDEIIEQRLQALSLHPVPIERFPESAEDYRKKGFTWAMRRLSWPAALSKYLFDEPPGLNDDFFTIGLENNNNPIQPISPRLT